MDGTPTEPTAFQPSGSIGTIAPRSLVATTDRSTGFVLSSTLGGLHLFDARLSSDKTWEPKPPGPSRVSSICCSPCLAAAVNFQRQSQPLAQEASQPHPSVHLEKRSGMFTLPSASVPTSSPFSLNFSKCFRVGTIHKGQCRVVRYFRESVPSLLTERRLRWGYQRGERHSSFDSPTEWISC